MPLFRFHRGGLKESLATTKVINNFSELRNLLKSKGYDYNAITQSPYPDENNNFDDRIGWYTYIVMSGLSYDKLYPAGFLSEKLEPKVDIQIYYPGKIGREPIVDFKNPFLELKQLPVASNVINLYMEMRPHAKCICSMCASYPKLCDELKDELINQSFL